MSRTITIHDVARRAGVSISTVSRVLNKSARVAEDKRRRVEEAIRELGYTPNPVARSLLKKRTGGIGVLVPFVGGEFFARFLAGVEYGAHPREYYLMVSSTHYDRDELFHGIQRFAYRVDGLLIMSPSVPADELLPLIPEGMQVVFVNTPYEKARADIFNFDNFGGAYRMVSHMLAQGARKVAFIGGPSHAFDARERQRGYRQALLDHGLPLMPELEREGDFNQHAGYTHMKALLDEGYRPDAVFSANDDMALGILAALREAGLRVPEEVMVGAFDNVPAARYASPTLSTVHVPVQELAQRATERLLHRIEHPQAAPVQEETPVELVLRASTQRKRPRATKPEKFFFG